MRKSHSEDFYKGALKNIKKLQCEMSCLSAKTKASLTSGAFPGAPKSSPEGPKSDPGVPKKDPGACEKSSRGAPWKSVTNSVANVVPVNKNRGPQKPVLANKREARECARQC